MSHCFCNKKLSLVEYLKVHSYALKPLERYGMGGAARSGSLHCLGHFELPEPDRLGEFRWRSLKESRHNYGAVRKTAP